MKTVASPAARFEVALGTEAVSRVVFVAPLAVFSPSVSSEFIRDDPWQIVKNPQIQSWDYLPRLFSSHVWSQSGTDYGVHFYRPLFSLWMLIVNTLGGLSPMWWHFSSMLLYALATLLGYRVCEKWERECPRVIVCGTTQPSIEEKAADIVNQSRLAFVALPLLPKAARGGHPQVHW